MLQWDQSGVLIGAVPFFNFASDSAVINSLQWIHVEHLWHFVFNFKMSQYISDIVIIAISLVKNQTQDSTLMI